MVRLLAGGRLAVRYRHRLHELVLVDLRTHAREGDGSRWLPRIVVTCRTVRPGGGCIDSGGGVLAPHLGEAGASLRALTTPAGANSRGPVYLRGIPRLFCEWCRAISAKETSIACATTRREVSASARGDHMAASPERAQRGVDSNGVSFVSISASIGAEDVVVPDTVTNDDVASRRADDLDAEAPYYPTAEPSKRNRPWVLAAT